MTPEQREHLHQTLLWLCSIPSPIGEEERLCEAVHHRLQQLPLPEPIRRIANSLVVPLVRHGKQEGQQAPFHIALVGHLDTVRAENGPARLEGDRCFGSGSSDMKSGLAVMMTLAERIALSMFVYDITLFFYAREEGPYAENELGLVLEQITDFPPIDLAVCMEPSDNRIHLGCMGSLHARLEVEGRSAHSARPWEGENAILKTLPLLEDLARVAPKECVVDGLTYRTVTSVTQIADGGRGRNVIPDRLTLNINHRFPPGVSLEKAEREVVSLVAGRARISWIDKSPSAMPYAAHPLVQALTKLGVRGIEPKQAWTDVARFAAKGIAAINFGPGENAQAHQKNESTSLVLLEENFVLMRRWLTAP
ncbi:succinyl-diaminopimelate desuccinylase [Pajaroellobacter abortibovis]|uniref:Succinyl-diaminopimelate desuccinylase n=1 Tax=Pajaroellobacter abortibovis TaxID=1882918 RepID=A0A1L6MXQ6_9BACT|nr:succinyl-diaminopimelate desuccinylase [Pajaroellobacter abortibovis]APS00280.1 succinyl-diaminopimelate desuccinylase [Pajaroellobacter abortibovis]